MNGQHKRYPAIRDFVRAYLHEDFVEEYGSAEEAAAAFCVDATPAERARLRDELAALLAELQAHDADPAAFFRDGFTSAWEPGSPSELAELLEIVRQCD